MFGTILTAMWLGFFIFTLIPNIITIKRLIKKEVNSIIDQGFVYFMSNFIMIILSLIKTIDLIYQYLSNFQ